MAKLRAIVLILLGAIILFWAGSRTAAEILPALQPTPTPGEIVEKNLAPRAGAANRQAASGEVESLPLAPTRTPRPTPSAVPPVPRPVLPPETSQQDLDRKVGSFLAERIVVVVVTSTPAPVTAPEPAVPDRIVIPAIDLDAPVTLASEKIVRIGGNEYEQWDAPNLYAAGWHSTSAALGLPGNTVLDGHNNIYGAVFARLQDLSQGDAIEVYSGEQVFQYRITNVMILPESGQPVEQRLENARWLSRSEDERLTLVTCWPNDSNTHRLIVVAVPAP